MIQALRDADRHLVRDGELSTLRTFEPLEGHLRPGSGLNRARFRRSFHLDELRFSRDGGTVGRPSISGETVTLVHRGALAQTDSKGRSSVMHAGEVQLMNAAHAMLCDEMNGSLVEGAQVFRVSLHHPASHRSPKSDRVRLSATQRRNQLCPVASPDGPLRIKGRVAIFTCELEAGHQLDYELGTQRYAWVHIMSGEARLGELALAAGDGAGVLSERALSVTTTERCDLLLLVLGGGGAPGRCGRVHRATSK